MNPHEILKQMKAYGEAVRWSKGFQSAQDAQDAWDKCERGDLMLWYLGKKADPQSKSRKELVLAACKCARLALRHLPKGETRPLKAIKTAEKWANGDTQVTLQDVRDAAYDAYDADDAAAYDAARKETLKNCADIVRKMHPTI